METKTPTTCIFQTNFTTWILRQAAERIISLRKCHNIISLPIAVEAAPALHIHGVLAISNVNRQWLDREFQCLWDPTSFLCMSETLLLLLPANKSPCFSFWQWIQYEYSQIPNYWNYISLLPVAIHSYHFSAGKKLCFLSFFVVASYSCGKAAVCWHSEPTPVQLLTGVSAQRVRVRVQREVASLASLDWKGINPKMNPSVFSTALFILSNAAFWQFEALFTHHCCHLSIHLSHGILNRNIHLLRQNFLCLFACLPGYKCKHIFFECKILNRQFICKENTGRKKEQGMFDGTYSVLSINRSHLFLYNDLLCCTGYLSLMLGKFCMFCHLLTSCIFGSWLFFF